MRCVAVFLSVCFLYSVLGNPDSRGRDDEETIHMQYHSDTYLRFMRHREVPDNRETGKSSLALEKGRRLKEFLRRAYVNDSGHVVNCGAKTTKIDISWTPKTINSGGDVTVNVDVVVPVDVEVAKCNVDVYLEGGKDPIISMPREVRCEELQKLVKQLNCPIKKGFPFKATKLFPLQPYSAQIPEGNFTVKAHCKNQKEEEIFCIQADIHIVSNDDFRK